MGSFAGVLESLVSMGPERIERFGASLPQEWIEEALAATGTASIRRRKLPAEQVLWLVLGMALFQDRSIRDVVDHLGLVMPGDGADSLAPSGISNARGRLGPEPVAWLFNRVAAHWSNQGGGRGYAGLSLFAVDGTCSGSKTRTPTSSISASPGAVEAPATQATLNFVWRAS